MHDIEDVVPEEIYEVPIGIGAVKREGKDVTLVAVSYMVQLSMEASEDLAKDGIDVEVLDLRSIKPLDKPLLLESVYKTGRLVVADIGRKTYGMASEIASIVFEEAFDYIKSPPVRMALPDVPAPASCTLEKAYYPTKREIIDAVRNVMNHRL